MINSLRSRRLELGMTQAQVAKVIGYNKGTYANIESGKRSPSLKVAQLISSALGSTIDEIFIPPQRQLRENDTQGNFNTTSNSGGSHSIAAAELSEVKSSEMVKASEDLQDGRADTPEGEKVLRLMRQTGGAALAV